MTIYSLNSFAIYKHTYSDHTLTDDDNDDDKLNHHRSRRDTLPTSPTNFTDDSKLSDNPANDSTDLLSASSDTVRTPRQLRPPSLAPSAWLQYDNQHDSHQRNIKSYQPNRFSVGGGAARYIQSQPQSTSATRFYKSDAAQSQSSIIKNEFSPQFGSSFSKGNSLSDGLKSNINFQYPTDDEFQPFQRFKQFDYFPNQYKTSSTKTPTAQHSVHLPLFLGGNAKKSSSIKSNADDTNYPFFNIAAKNKIPNVAVLPNATPKSHYISFSTVAGFYNNQPAATTTLSPIMDAYKQYNQKYRASGGGGGGSQTITPAPVYEQEDSGNVYFSKNYFPTLAQGSSDSMTTTTTTRPPQYTYYPTTTLRIQPDMTSGNYYQKSAGISKQYEQNKFNIDSTTETPIGHYITQSSYEPVRSTTSSAFGSSSVGTIGPVVGIDFDFEKFIERIRSGQSSKLSPTSIRNATVLSAIDDVTSATTTKPSTRDWPLTTGVIATKSTPRPFIHSKVSKLIALEV